MSLSMSTSMKSGLNGISADRPFPVTCPVGDLCGSNLTFHIGQDNRTNIPKRDVDGADQSSDSTLTPLHQPNTPKPSKK